MIIKISINKTANAIKIFLTVNIFPLPLAACACASFNFSTSTAAFACATAPACAAAASFGCPTKSPKMFPKSKFIAPALIVFLGFAF